MKFGMLTSLCLWFFRILLMSSLVIGAVGLASAHPKDWEVKTRLVVAEWASAVQGQNHEELTAILSDDFEIPAGPTSATPRLDRTSYVAGIGSYPITKVILRHAEYSIDQQGVTVSPVVVYPNPKVLQPRAYSIHLARHGDAWKITTVDMSGGVVPEELIDTRHPKRFQRLDVPVSLVDADTGEPVRARVNIHGVDGEYWPPQFHSKHIPVRWRVDVGGDVVIGGKTYAYVTPDFILPVPPGDYVMEVVRGIEYEPVTANFTVSEDSIPQLKIELKRWIHMADRGWRSGDTHVHFITPQTAAVEAQGEDLNVINVLGSAGGDLHTELNNFTGEPSVFSTEDYVVYVGEETRHNYLGHTVLLNLKELIFPMGWGPPTTGVVGGIDYPTMAHQADKAHAQGGLVAWAHFPEPHGELAIDMALGKIDAAEVFVFGDPRDETTRNGPFRTWYRLLNVGIDVPGLGATDKMWNTQISGGVRTYVKMDGAFTYENWVDGIARGRTFLTTGPMLEFSLGDAELGDTISLTEPTSIPYRAVVEAREPLELVELIVDGEVVATKEAASTRVVFEGEYMFQQSSWAAVRASTGETLPIQNNIYPARAPVLGHTSPIYVEMNGAPRRSAEDAAFLLRWCDEAIDWAQNRANYATQAQRDEVVAIYSEARSFYAAQIAQP